MRKTIKIIGLAVLVFLMTDTLETFAQGKIEISPTGGYMFGGKMRFYEGELKIQNAATYGVAGDFELAPDTKIEIAWNQMNSSAEFNPYYGYEELRVEPFDATVGYIHIGGMQEMDMDNIVPFGLFTLGATYFTPKNTTYTQSWKFSVALGGGAKIWFSDRVGIRLQGRLLLPMFWGGAGFTVGTGGAGMTVGAGTTMVQGDLTAGLVIALGD